MSSHDQVLLYPSFGYSLEVVLPLVTAFWFIVAVLGVVIPFFCRKNPNRLTIQVSIVTLSICFYVFWLLAFLVQLNPLVAPIVDYGVAGHMRKVWAFSQIPPGDERTDYGTCFPSW